MASNPPNSGSAAATLPVVGQVSEGRALAEYGAAQSTPVILTAERGTILKAPFLVLPSGKKLESLKPLLDEYLTQPERKKGTAKLTTLTSLIEHINRFKDGESAVFANDDRKAPSITAVLDYHQSGATGNPRFGQHRAHYAFPVSDEWQAWMKSNGEMMDQADFAAFMEDRIADVLHPPLDLDKVDADQISQRMAGGDFSDRTPDEQLAYLAKQLKGKFASPSAIMELSRGLSIRANNSVKQAINLPTGEATISFETTHSDATGNSITVPNLFLIGIPVFRGDARYRIAARLRYRLIGGIKWFYELYRHDLVFDDAFTKACAQVKDKTLLPLFYGSPEDAGKAT